MHKLHALLTGFCLFAGLSSFGQLEQKHWYYGDRQGLDFTTSGPVYDNAAYVNNTIYGQESSAVQSDPSGNLVFYSDGYNLWNGNHVLWGTNIGGDISSASGEISIPDPANSNQYYLILTSVSFGARYRIITNTGGGTISVGALQSFPAGSGYPSGFLTGEGVTAIAGCGNDYWVILKGTDNSGQQNLIAYSLTSSGLAFNSDIALPFDTYYTSVEAAPSGNQVALGSFLGENRLFLIDFDKLAGTFSNERLLGTLYDFGSWIYGLQFSPDSKLLYAYEETYGKLFQFDATSANPAATKVFVSNVSGSSPQLRTTPQLGLDGLIYMGEAGLPQLGVIANPNTLCTVGSPNACNYSNGALALSNTYVSGGLPNFVDANVFTTMTNTISYTIQGCLSATFAPNICADDLNWDFGDPASGGSNTSTLSHPTHVFSAPGTYTVTLNASGTIITCDVVIDYQLSVAGRDSLCVTTSNNSAIYITNLPTPSQTISWSITGGSGSITGPTNQQNAFVTWTSLPGTLTVTLTDADAGCVSTTTYDVYSNCDTTTCVCGFKAGYDYTVDQKSCLYSFKPLFDGPNCLNILKYEWDFGDGTTSTLMHPQHTFPANGSYIVCLTITATNGTQVCKDTYCEEIKVNCQKGGCDCKLSPSFTYTIDYQRCLVRFSGASGGPACLQNVQYFWDFGDGTTGTGQFVSHVYTAPGSYVICMTVQAFNGVTTCTSTYCFEITHDCHGTKSLELNDTGTDIFPNPAQSEVNVRLDVAEAGPVTLTLFSTDGRTLLSETRQLEAGVQTVRVALPESAATGVALLEIRTDDRTTTHKIAIRH